MRTLFLLLVIAGIWACQDQSKQTKTEEARGVDLSYMDTTVAPSEDFYQYVNGGWMATTEIPADRSRWGSFDELRKRTINNVLTVLEMAADNDKYGIDSDQGKAVAFYMTAMDSNHIDSMGLTHVQPYMDEILNAASKEELHQVLNEQQNIGTRYFFSIGARADFNNSSMNTAYLSPGTMGLPDRDYYTKTDDESVRIQDEYKSHISKMLQLIDIPETEATNTAERIFSLEKSMAQAMLTKVQRRNTVLLNNPRSKDQVKEMASNIMWDDYIAAMEAPAFDTMIVTEPRYIKALDSVWNNSSIEDLKEYMRWSLLNRYAEYLNDEIEAQNFAFYGKILQGTPEMKPRWERVLDKANWTVGEAIGKLYVDKHFPPEAKSSAEEMVNNILEAFGERIDRLEWMSDSTKEKAHEKLATFAVKIGYPDEWEDYSGMEILPADKGGTYAGNMIAASKWRHQDQISRIGKKVDTTEWYMAPQVVNAYYNPMNNEIVFPAAILQPPFYDYKADAAVNYGGIGAVIGHEISHGFDDQGSRFDAQGNLKNWWTQADKERFEDRTTKLVKQYNAYEPLPGVNVNGEFTLGENIGDLGGVAVAYDGLEKHWKEHGKPDSIQGFSPEQRFFISWATIWRTKMRDEALKTRIKTDPHSPGMYRAIGPLVNVDAFYTAFDIQPDDALYKPDSARVKIW
jgi:predicted metalloendopeptidase